MDERRGLWVPGAGTRPPSPARSITIQTRVGGNIENEFADEEMPEYKRRTSDEHIRSLVARKRGDSACAGMELRRMATARYNCHGLTFANRRTNIRAPATVEQILKEDGYAPVAPADVMPGDVVAYCQGEEIIHTGVVVSVDRTQHGSVPYVLSKWGAQGEYIHPDGVYPQHFDAIRYYREGQR